MKEYHFRLRLGILSLLLLCSAILFLWPTVIGQQNASLANRNDASYLKVVFLDVGQGDAIYIETFDGVQLLIDGGPNNAVMRELSSYLSLFDRSLDVVLATHTDKDHIGGLVDVLERYQIDQIILTENSNDTAVAEAFSEAVTTEGAEILKARAGQALLLGASTTLTIYSPATNPENWESNAASIVAQLKYGDIEFMLTGDASLGVEEYLVKNYGTVLESEVLKLGHHGSRTSTADSFLDTVSPLYAVASAGKDNRYGHPHAEVLEKLSKRNIKTLNTAEFCSIVFQSDGREVWMEI